MTPITPTHLDAELLAHVVAIRQRVLQLKYVRSDGKTYIVQVKTREGKWLDVMEVSCTAHCDNATNFLMVKGYSHIRAMPGRKIVPNTNGRKS